MKTGTNEFAQYQDEVDQQCRFIIGAATALEKASVSQDRSLAAHLTVYHSQQLLTAAGIASMLLWGPKRNPRVTNDRRPRRESLNVTDASPLKPRDVRDSHAHIDERITDAMNTGPTVVTMRLGKPPTDPQEAARPLLRHYDATTGELGFGGDIVKVPDLFDEASRIDAVWAALNPGEVAMREGRFAEWLASKQ